MTLSGSMGFNLILALLMTLVFGLYQFLGPGGTRWSAVEIVVSLLLFGGLTLAYAGMADAETINRLRKWTERRSLHVFLPAIGLFFITLAYIAMVRSILLRDVLTASIYLFLPLILLWRDRGHPQRFNWRNLLALLICWWMIEWKLVPQIDIPPRGGLPFFRLVALNNVIFSFLVVRELMGVGYRLLPEGRDWGRACVYFSMFVAFFAVPIGLRTGFIQPTHQWRPLWQLPFMLLGMFFFTGIPEEFVFRGILQNLLSNTIRGRRGRWISLAISSVVFGLAHLNNPVTPLVNLHLFGFEYPVPWVYLILATIAGWFYGLAYIQTGSILAAALLHTMVDGWWGYFFGGK